MSATRSRPRRHAVVATAALLAAWSFLVGAPAAAADGSAAATSTALDVRPGTSVTVETVLTLSARVSPARAAGFVRFTGDGRVLASVDVVGGLATSGVLHLPVGTWDVVATFVPYDPGAFTSSQSAAVPMAVAGVPSVWVATASGQLVPGSAPVQTGRTYSVHVAGFPAYTRIVVRMGAQTLAPGITADAAGAGSLPVVLPADLAPGVYTVDASAGPVESQVVFYVIPSGGPSPTTTAAAATAVPSVSGAPAAATTTSSPQGGLAHTGADPLAPLASGLGLLLAGGLLVAGAGDRRTYRARH